MKKVLIGCGIALGVLFVALLAGVVWLGMQIESGAMPDTMIVAGNKLRTPAREAINKAISLRPGETITFFYSTGLLSWEEDGNLITNQRVVSYMQDEGQLVVEEADYDNIEEITPIFSEEWIDDTLVWITPKEGDEFMIALSIEDDLDHPAVDYIQKKIKEAKQ